MSEQQLFGSSDNRRVQPSRVLLALLVLSACKVYDPLYCDEKQQCTDPDRPFCDLAGEYPASEGVGRTCIPSPFDAGSSIDGGGGDGGAGSDAARGRDAAPACSWAPLSRLANVNSSQRTEYAGSLDAEGLTLYFSRAGNTPEDGLFYATRGSVGEAFGQAMPIDELSGDGVFRSSPEISSSRLEIVYSVLPGFSIEGATRDSPTGIFDSLEPTGLEGDNAALSGDGLALYFIAKGSGTVQRATRTDIGEPWGTPVTVLPLEGYYAVDVSPDERRILLTKNPLVQAPMPFEIAERTSADGEFGAPIPLNDEILVPDAQYYANAKWDGSQTHMVASVTLTGGTYDLYYSACQ